MLTASSPVRSPIPRTCRRRLSLATSSRSASGRSAANGTGSNSVGFRLQTSGTKSPPSKGIGGRWASLRTKPIAAPYLTCRKKRSGQSGYQQRASLLLVGSLLWPLEPHSTINDSTIRSHIHIFNLDLPRQFRTMREVNLVHGNKKWNHGRATTSKERTTACQRHQQISTAR